VKSQPNSYRHLSSGLILNHKSGSCRRPLKELIF
jgi:hypothetical protein